MVDSAQTKEKNEEIFESFILINNVNLKQRICEKKNTKIIEEIGVRARCVRACRNYELI